MHHSIPELGRWLRAVVQGYYNHHGVLYNLPQMNAFRHHLSRAWLRMLKRRSQKARKALTWDTFKRLRDYWLPTPRLTHPWPNTRFRRQHPRQEPYAVIPHVRICTGASREGRCYRDYAGLLLTVLVLPCRVAGFSGEG